MLAPERYPAPRIPESCSVKNGILHRQFRNPAPELRNRQRDEDKMAECLRSIIETCKGTKNIHFEWFASLIEKHWDWIISHSVLGLSNGKIEGINNRIKTVRRMGYGYPDDEYFFLKLMDMSRNRPTQTLH